MVVCSCSEHLYERLKQSDPERATGRETIPLTNDELFTFHSVRAMLNEMVQVIPPVGAEGLDRRGPAGSCRLFLGPGIRLGAR